MTARPPSLPISMAVAGETTPSMAEAMRGSSNVQASISQDMSTSSGSRVRREGTMATSSNPYARLPVFPIPISISIHEPPGYYDVIVLGGNAKRPPDAGQASGTSMNERYQPWGGQSTVSASSDIKDVC